MRLDAVSIGGLRFGPLSTALRDRLLAEARAADLSYGPPVGHTLDPAVPMHTEHLDVGRGRADFLAARDALRTWVGHRGVGFTIVPEGASVVAGDTVLVILRWGPAFVVARNRIVAVIDEPRRFGFAYGTVHGHPERGEESFVVEWRDDDPGGGTVRFTIRVESASASWAAKLVEPLVKRWQFHALRGYLRAVGDHVGSASRPPQGRPDATP